MNTGEVHKTDPFIQYALAAAIMRAQDAGLKITRTPQSALVFLVGSGRGGVTTIEKNVAAYLARGHRAVSPFFPPMSLVNMASGYISMKLGAKRPVPRCFHGLRDRHLMP